MENSVLSLSKKLIKIRSTPDSVSALEKVLHESLAPLKDFTVEWFEKNGSKSALVYSGTKRPKKFRVILNGHLDIIPGKDEQYTPKTIGNKLYGAGVMDMKSNTACLIHVFKTLAQKVQYPLGLQLVTDEEIGGFNGTKYQIDRGVKADFVIVGEATNLNIENKTKGILQVKISTKGITAHGAYPWKGKNAVWKMNQFLNILSRKFPEIAQEQWTTTVNVSNIITNNTAFNKIPDHCEIWLDIRYVPEQSKTIVKDLKKLLPKEFTMEILVNEPALSTDEKDTYVQLLRSHIEKVTHHPAKILSANGSSDARHFARVGTPAVEFGPIGGGMGSDNEWVDIKSLRDYSEVLENFLLSI